MDSSGQSRLQCQCCGKPFETKLKITYENSYIYNVWCPYCKEKVSALNVGEGDLDYYEFYNVNFDARYY